MGSPVTMVSVKTSASLVMIPMIAMMFNPTSSQPSPVYPNKNKCKSQTKEIAPIIYQNKSGHLKLINKENSTSSSEVQKFKVSYCLDLGSSCTSCHDKTRKLIRFIIVCVSRNSEK